jgi:hypothetical protein
VLSAPAASHSLTAKGVTAAARPARPAAGQYRALQDLMSDPRGVQCGAASPRPIAASPSARGNAMARWRVRTATTVAAKAKAEAVHKAGSRSAVK